MLTFSILFGITVWEHKTPSEKDEGIGNVATGLEKTIDSERDTIQKDDMIIKKESNVNNYGS